MTNEVISDEKFGSNDKLFYHIPIGVFAPYFDFNTIPPHAFTPQGDGLSVNWEKYCLTADDCLQIRTDKYPEGRTAKTHGVGHFVVKDIEAINYLSVVYSPSMYNKAHSVIEGIPPRRPKAPFLQMRKELSRVFKSWDICPEKGDD